MANLVVDIGNTALKAAWADGVTLGKTFRYQGERMTDFILSIAGKSRPDVLVVSSVREISPCTRETGNHTETRKGEIQESWNPDGHRPSCATGRCAEAFKQLRQHLFHVKLRFSADEECA